VPGRRSFLERWNRVIEDRAGAPIAVHAKVYTDAVRASLAVLTVLLILLVTTADRVACPDGCADLGSPHATGTEASLCGLCHGWSGPRVVASVAPAAEGLRSIPVAVPSAHAAYLPAIDHPPRFA
jgi:hypothetical protein